MCCQDEVRGRFGLFFFLVCCDCLKQILFLICLHLFSGVFVIQHLNICIYNYIYMTRIIYNYIMPQGLSKLILFEPNKVLEILPCVFFLVSSKATVGKRVLMI